MTKLKNLFKRIFGREDNFPTNEEKMTLWVARDKDEALCLYNCRPIRERNHFWALYGFIEVLEAESTNLFPSVTFENSPQKVELKLVKE
jgi:hypothetical protein